MAFWESGRESGLLDDIIAGRKTIEGRLKRDKFAQYQVGDQIWLRRDYRNETGRLVDGSARQALVEITALREYRSFLAMATTEGFERVIPSAPDAQAAADIYNRYYAAIDQATYGVLAVEIKLIQTV